MSYLVTGYPGFVGRRLLQQIAHKEPAEKVYLLVQPKFVQDAWRFVEKISPQVEILQGDVVDMHLGLSGDEYRKLRKTVTQIFHLAAINYLGVPREIAHRVNVEGTRNVLELAKECEQLARFNHFSTCYVSGDRVGVIAEDELDVGQTFRNAYEETKFLAEKLVHHAGQQGLPFTIFRPSSVIGDSKTGEIDRFEGPYYLAILLVTSPLSVPLPLPGDGVAPLNVVPADFVVEATLAISQDLRALGKTFHLVDPNPMSARRVYELIAQKANKKLPRFHLPAKAADVVLGLPLLERLVRPQRQAVNYVNHLAIYNCHHTLEILDGTGIRCPSLESYLDTLVKYVRGYYQQKKTELTPEELSESQGP